MAISKEARRRRIRYRIRKKISGTAVMPRLSVFRSNKEIYAQLIDDESGNTICAASSRDKDLMDAKGTKSETAILVGKKLAKIAGEKGLTEARFDRGGYLYHGRVKSLAEGAREGGLKI